MWDWTAGAWSTEDDDMVRAHIGAEEMQHVAGSRLAKPAGCH
jgi:hypothetical protein